jgi:hypothetical protein
MGFSGSKGEKMSVSRESFDVSKGYLEVQFNQDVPLLDSELNEAQKILRASIEDTRRAGFGTACAGDEWRVVTSPETNSIVVKKGTFFHNGNAIRLLEDVTIGFLTTPVTDRIDTIFCEYYFGFVDATLDPDILDPAVGLETSQRIKLFFSIRVGEGVAFPVPPSNRFYFQLATLRREAANPSITETMITDDRYKTVHTYVVQGAEVKSAGGLSVSITQGQVRVAGNDYFVETTQPTVSLPGNSTRYLIMAGETISQVAILPNYYHVVLARVVTGMSTVNTIEDRRIFQPVIYAQPRVQPDTVDPNPEPGVDKQSYFAGEAIQKFGLVYLTSTSNVVGKASNVSSNTAPVIGMALTSLAANNEGSFLRRGQVYNPSWNWTLGLPIFLGLDGNMTQTPPSADLTIIQKVAMPVTPSTIEFNPSFFTVRN